MSRPVIIEKQSGEKEHFDPQKLRDSLQKAGASKALITKVEAALQRYLADGVTTSEIYRRAFGLLRKFQRSTAARYSLKKAIMELGPSGYPFEHFVGQLLKHLGYEIEVGQTIAGQCIKHEVDVVAHNEHQQFMVECKYYNSQGKYCNVKVPLYIHSRFTDIEKRWKSTPGLAKKSFHGWVFTNTKFTSDAMEYGRCVGLRMVSWDYPQHESLKDMIHKTGLFPITVLTLLNRKQRQQLLEKDIVLCRQLYARSGLLDQFDLSSSKKRRILEEISELIDPDALTAEQ
ncbi:MAG: restriction endonuclease [Bacteroidales bacterium]|nr:restriction endonuclease [Bacteroidales bacterium]